MFQLGMQSRDPLGRFTTLESGIYRGDSLELLKQLPKKKFSLILTDPPYNISKNNNLHTMGRKGIDFGNWDKGFDQISWIKLAEPLLKEGGNLVIWNDWNNLGDIAKYLSTLGFSVKRMLIWEKSNPMPRNRDRSFVQSIETALWAVKKGKWVFNRKSPAYERGIFKYPVQKSDHPTKKPNGLFQEIIELLSNPGDWILDPFAGSGTTSIAASASNRNHISIEKDSKYYTLAVEKWKQATSPQLK